MDLLQSVIGFVLAIGVLVAFHEFGHYWVARRLGVKVLRYSIGFGTPLLRWRRGKDDIEYAISAIPLGGYVKMLDEREGPVPEAELHRAFNRQSLAVRSAIVAAGPVFNLLFALLAYWAIFVLGSQELKPIVGEVAPSTPAAAAGLAPGDEILAIDGAEVRSWDQILMELVDAGVDQDVVPVSVRTEGGEQVVRALDLSGVRMLGEEQDYLRVVGLRPWQPQLPAVVGRVMPESAAAQAGVQPGDRIVAIDGRPVTAWFELVEYVGDRPGRSVQLTLQRDGQTVRAEAALGAREVAGQPTRGSLGVEVQVPEDPAALYQGMLHEVRYGPLAAMARSAEATWTASSLTVKVMWQMIVGNASLKNLSGPINIAQYAGDSFEMGVAAFLKFLAIVSVSLAVLNLLPVPVLDGGHLLYYGLEAIRGRPLSERAQAVGQQIGVGLLLLLMSVAFYNDINRLLGQ